MNYVPVQNIRGVANVHVCWVSVHATVHACACRVTLQCRVSVHDSTVQTDMTVYRVSVQCRAHTVCIAMSHNTAIPQTFCTVEWAQTLCISQTLHVLQLRSHFALHRHSALSSHAQTLVGLSHCAAPIQVVCSGIWSPLVPFLWSLCSTWHQAG